MFRTKLRNLKNDEELVAEFRQTNDMQCIEILFNRYSELLFAVSMKYLHNEDESKEAVLEIFSKLPGHLMKYEIKNFGSWIYTITKNYCFHFLKTRKFHLPEEALNHLARGTPPAPDFDEIDYDKILHDHLSESLDILNKEQRLCIDLFYFGDKSYEEIQAETGFTYMQVKSHIQNGKRNLRIYLDKFLQRKK